MRMSIRSTWGRRPLIRFRSVSSSGSGSSAVRGDTTRRLLSILMLVVSARVWSRVWR